MIKKNTATRDGNNKSPWQEAKSSSHPETNTDTIYDVLIIGGGITGMTAGLMLQTSGKKCLLVEAHTTGFGTTGGTSAHINTFADTTYKEAESAFGEEGAQLFAQAINEGFDIIQKNVETFKIACDYEIKDGFVYAEDDKQSAELEDIYTGTIKVGVDVNFSRNVPIPVPYKEALLFKNQAQFHPIKYLMALQEAFLTAGGEVCEGARVNKVETEENIHFASINDRIFKAIKIVYATHIPPGINVFNLRCAPYRSYVMGVILKDKNYPDALVYDMQEPYHYFRTHEIEGQKYLIVGGNDHKTGHGEPEKAFSDLEKYIRTYYDVAEVKYKWSSQYYVPVDGLPYIGQMPNMGKGIYCATGFNGNGMMLGSVAAKIIHDLIIRDESTYEKLFDPTRLKPIAGFKDFVKENADVAYQFVASHFAGHKVDFIKRVQPGTGKIVELDGEQVAVYRDEEGNVYALSPRCKHLGCIVNWNAEEKSWDCPCHGARYDIDGTVLNGPATSSLEKFVFD